MNSRGLGTGWLIRALAAVGLVFMLAPVVALLARVRWGALMGIVVDPSVAAAARLSLATSAAAVTLSAVVGIPLAWLLGRTAFPGRRLVRSLVLLPMVLPPVVAGIALLAALGRTSVVGGWLAQVGVTLPFTAVGTAVAQAFVAAPFLIVAAEAGFSATDRRLEDAALGLGASRWMVWRTVILPAVRPSLIAGLALCWARALGEFGATITFAGSLRGRTETLPLTAYRELQTDPDGAVAVGVLLLVISLAVLVSLRGRLVSVR